MNVLLTAFDPFGGEAINPALEAVKQVRSKLAGITVIKLEVPTIFGKSIERLAQSIKEVQPDVVLCIGQAGGRFGISVERVAINLDDARIPDNEGNQPVDTKIVESGPPAYFSTLPIKAMVEAIKNQGIPSSISNTAGTFVCNHLMYGALHILSSSEKPARGGFIHVPFIPSQVVSRPNVPSMALSDIVTALEAAIMAIGAHDEDVKVSGGREF
ncbi:MAG: pyroglutamyl-peptidase I [Sphaerochaetaceae bacterium]